MTSGVKTKSQRPIHGICKYLAIGKNLAFPTNRKKAVYQLFFCCSSDHFLPPGPGITGILETPTLLYRTPTGHVMLSCQVPPLCLVNRMDW